MKKLIRITTVPSSLRTLLKGQHKFMNNYFEVVGVSGAGDALDEVRDNEGIRTEVIEMTRTISPLKDLKATYLLYKLLKKEEPHIVHTHTPKAGIVGMLAAKLAGVKHRYHTVAGMPLLLSTGFKRKILNTVEKLTYKFATLVLPNSFGLYDIILDEKFTTKNKLKVIANGSSNGINTTHYDSKTVSNEEKETLRNQLNIKPTDFVYIFVGRIVADKGINELVAAFNEVSKTNSDVKLLLVGPKEDHLNPLQPETEAIIKENANILAVGMQREIRPYVAISHTLTFPSHREGFPNVVLQCSAMSLPCIVSNINGCNEIIEDTINGLIIPPKNVEELATAMQYIKDNPEVRNKMIGNSRSNIEAKYKQEIVWKELLNLYQNAE